MCTYEDACEPSVETSSLNSLNSSSTYSMELPSSPTSMTSAHCPTIPSTSSVFAPFLVEDVDKIYNLKEKVKELEM